MKLTDESINTSIKSDNTDLDPNQYITVKFGADVPVSTIFVFTGKSRYTNGLLDVYVHSNTGDAFGAAERDLSIYCGQFGHGKGGVMDCSNTVGAKLTFYCSSSTGCTSKLSFRMVRVWS